MSTSLLTNRFLAGKDSNPFYSRPKNRWSTPFSKTGFSIVSNGAMMDPFYREISESGHAKRGRSKHLGADITGPKAGNGSITDPRRGLPVYAAVRTSIAISDLNNVRAYNKSNGTSLTGVGITGTGNATLAEAKIYTQPWSSTEDHAYGGIVGMSCIYAYQSNQGGTAEFTLYVEWLHLITEQFLPKDKSARIATLSEWQDTGRGIGFGPEMQNGRVVKADFFDSSGLPIIGYLGATQTPHVHVQAAYFNSRSYSKVAVIRVDPMVVVY